MSDKLDNEWAMRNFGTFKTAIETLQKENQQRQEEIINLRKTITMINVEFMQIKTRLNILQHGKVQGSLS